MNTRESSAPRIPVICADPSARAGAVTFNPNSWSRASRGIVQSCWTEFSVLHHCVGQIADLCWARMNERDLLAAWTAAQTDESLRPIPPLK